MTSAATRLKATLAGVIGLALAAAPLTAISASANTAGTGVVINEVYLNGGSSGASYKYKFVELYNPTDAAVNLSGTSVQYRSATGVANPTGVIPLSGSIPSHGYFLVQGASNNAATNPGAELPTPDVPLTGSGVSFGAAGGTIFLANQTTALTAPPTGSVVGNPAILDVFGYGTSNTYEGAVGSAASLTTSQSRKLQTTLGDSDNNASDFAAGAPSPTNAAGQTGGGGTTPPADPVAATIAQIQGTTDTSPYSGQTVVTDGVVTAAYPTGGFNGYYLQTPGTGGAIDFATHTSSDAVFVYSPSTVGSVSIGQHVRVTGAISEFSGLTELSVTSASGLTVLDDSVTAPTPATFAATSSAAQRESLEGMLVEPEGDYTVTDNYDTNYYASITLNPGTAPLDTPTDVVAPGAAAIAKAADNAARIITLDDGASINFNSAANKGIELPYLSTTNPVRIGAAVIFTKPMILDYRNSLWNLQPTQQLTTANASTVQTATFSNTRTDAPVALAGDATIASFNVLNYFTTTGDQLSGCTFYTDRDGNPITVNTGCDARGAANAASLKRQQDKIVAAINKLGASVVSLEEIENSVKFGLDRDASLAILVGALNDAAGAGTWDYVRSPAADQLEATADQDVIRTAFIYKPAKVQPVGTSHVLNDAAFKNVARQPLAQEFELANGDAGSAFLAIVNHFKSKGSGTGANADQGDGQGASNPARVAEAHALVTWADSLKSSLSVQRVILMGDFNAYLQEDPIKVLTDAGYHDMGSTTGKSTYAFDGAVGSLDHILVNDAAQASVTGADIWNINSRESIALEYSRYNYNALNLYEANQFRASDHDPILVGLDLATPAPTTVDLNLLNINDFHGRIDSNTVKFAGTIEQLRAAGGEDSTLLLSAGDNVGASLFASATQQDQPTIDVLNELDLTASAVGNHEFDQGYDDLKNRIEDAADWSYLGANVYLKGTTTPALPEYKIVTVKGVRVAIVGAVTEETPTLVSPGGITAVDFGDPVEAVNRVVAQLEASDSADVFIAEYHEGAGAGTPDGATLEQEVAAGGAFADIVTKTTPDVAAIFTGHTHKQYAWDAPIPGEDGKTRPILQTGEYGGNIGQIVLTINTADDSVVSYTAKNVARTTTADATLVSTYPRVAEVKQTVDAALAYAAQVGNTPVATITKDITTAYSGGSRDDRANESTLGDLVADALKSKLSSADLGGAQIGVVNPGGLRADLLYAGDTSTNPQNTDGVVTYAEANAVLPFVNNLWTTSLTGAQFKALLEQQWQTDASGAVPSRPYLQLGLSNNVTYTYDAAATQGNHITSISINGQAYDPAASYRIGTFSFLALGGDNFRTFTQGTNTKDSGLIDRDAWIDYLSTSSPVSPDYARQAVAATGIPTAAVDQGASFTLGLSKLDLTSLGSPANTTVTATLGDGTTSVGQATVTSGAANLLVTIPEAQATGATTLVVKASPSGTTVRIPLTIASSAAQPFDISLLNINDFHGRIDSNTVKFAGTIEQLRAAAGEDSTLLLSAGDNVGASLFASATQQDQPTIDVLNELDLKASAVGNHEFDKGWADLRDRIENAADWDYLGANVYAKGTTTPVLPEYDIETVHGVRVAIIGAVTQETPTLVSPGGITDIEFGDPVDAVNRVVAKLEATDAADVFVAEYHEGAGAGTPDGATLEQEVAAGGAFAKIVTQTSPDVDVIFTGHTHKQYAWDAPVPGVTGKTRPILQTGEYGGFIGDITLTIDPTTKDVTAYTAKNVARTTTADATLVSTYPRVAEVKDTVDAALAYAAQVGNQPVATITKDITTAYAGGARDDRASESTLGDLVADALKSKLSSADLGGAEIGVVNPGGLRADLLYAKSGAETTDGVVTYAEANAVLPFVNNLWTTSLTGAQFTTLLEQQWQTDANGNVPSRPYLQLGLSSNVTYTYDASAAQGHHISSVFVNGVALDPAKSYRIGTFSFLATGGDNFRIFTQGTNTKDSGLIDRDAWIDYLTANSPVSPDYARQAVQLVNKPTGAVKPGLSYLVTLGKLNLTSLGSPANTEVSAKFAGTDVEGTRSAVTADGTAYAIFTVPFGLNGSGVLEVTAKESGTVVRIPLEVAADPTITGQKPVITGTPAVGETLTVTTGDWTADGASVDLATQWLRDGTAITGATDDTYVVTAADAGHAISVQVTGSKDGLADHTETSDTVTVVAGTITGTAPTISGSPAVGTKLTATVGAYTPSDVTLSYRWYRSGAPISGAVGTSYTLTSADMARTVTFTVTAKKTGYTTLALSDKVVVERVLTVGTPSIKGTQAVGQKLTAVAGTWGPAPVKLSYQWKRDGVNISGAIHYQYTLTSADRGHRISVYVTGTKAGYTTVTKNAFTSIIK